MGDRIEFGSFSTPGSQSLSSSIPCYTPRFECFPCACLQLGCSCITRFLLQRFSGQILFITLYVKSVAATQGGWGTCSGGILSVITYEDVSQILLAQNFVLFDISGLKRLANWGQILYGTEILKIWYVCISFWMYFEGAANWAKLLVYFPTVRLHILVKNPLIFITVCWFCHFLLLVNKMLIF